MTTTTEEKLRKLVIRILEHYDPMFGYINLHRLDDREWMDQAREALGDETWLHMFPWAKRTKK